MAGRYGDAWKVRVTAPPEGGAANDAVVALLASALDLPQRAITLVSGHGHPDKTVEVEGISPAETESRLASAGTLGIKRKDSHR